MTRCQFLEDFHFRILPFEILSGSPKLPFNKPNYPEATMLHVHKQELWLAGPAEPRLLITPAELPKLVKPSGALHTC